MKDLFGKEITVDEARRLSEAKTTQAKGYAAPPGSGPAGDSCASCANLVRREYARTYLKCGLMRAHWTSGRGSDVLARAPACRAWIRADV